MSGPWAPRPHRSFADIRNGAGRKAMNPSHPKYRDDGYARELSDLAKDRECEFRAKDAKERGNDALADGNFSAAVQFYTTAVELNYRPELHIHYSNRSAAYAKLGRFDLALEDGDRCILVRPDWPKGYFRKGCALHGLRRPTEAVEALRLGLAIDPTNEGLKKAMSDAGTFQREAAQSYEEINNELHEASRQGDVHLARELISAGNDIAAADRDGNTPLHFAAWEGHTIILQLLTDSPQIDINARNKLGQSPLHLAGWWGKQHAAEWLINCKADLGIKDGGGETPLHHAARNSHDGLIRILCEGGAKTQIMNQAGQTAFDIADECCPLSSCRHEACARILKKWAEKGAQAEAANRPVGLAALPEGTVVSVSGLVSATQHNGKHGTIVGWNEEKGRFLVEMDQGGTLALKQASLAEAPSKRKRRADSKPEGNTSVYVTGLPTETGDVTDQFLATYFGRMGKVFRVKAYKNPDGSPKGDALVTYWDVDDAEKAAKLLHRQQIRSDWPISVVAADFTQSSKRTVRLRPEIIKTFKGQGGLGINFSDDWEIEEIAPGSQAELAGLRGALWLTHIQGELVVGKSRDEIYRAFGAAGRPISLGFITYRPPSLQEYDLAQDLLISGTVSVEEERAAEHERRSQAMMPTYFGGDSFKLKAESVDGSTSPKRRKSGFSE